MARFDSKSRYARAVPLEVEDAEGRTHRIVPPREMEAPRIVGVRRKKPGERLDHLAHALLRDASGYWRLCDANDAMLPDAIAEAEVLQIPEPDA